MSVTVAHVLKPLQKYLDEKTAIEIKVRRPGELHIENVSGQWRRVKEPALDLRWWRRLANSVAISTGQAFSERLPLLKAKLPGGHRLFLMLGPNVIDPDGGGAGVTASIRLFRRSDRRLTDFGLSAGAADTLIGGVLDRSSILVAGGTGSGKTTLTNILCDYIEDDAPVYIEDTEELTAKQNVSVNLLVSPATADTDISYGHILDAITRMRPDRLILGELTVDNAFITMRTLNIGVDGLMTTLHADSAQDAIPALAELLALKGYNAPHAIRFFERKIGLCVHCARRGDKRIVTEIIRPRPEGAEIVWRHSDVDQMAQTG